MPRCRSLATGLLNLVLLLTGAHAVSASAGEPDPAAGKRRTVTCNGCHGQTAMKNVPSLGGQNPAYFVAAMVAYQDGVRTHATMRDVAKAWSLQDLKNFAAWYAEPVAPAADLADAIAPPAAARCTACHGADGRETVTPEVPRIAGQKAGYLAMVMREYRAGTRTNALMQQQMADLSDDDIATLARPFGERPGLQVK
jgi:cytochrome c553